ncbi:hypothetical protein T552_04206 [Pneumocystis carinii B80]|uniref:Uncharacterized protein n=1 Tax=Pneumocystis carinii (strain B80) TaxID=1408658 RepID=A0A0W4ZCC0_PNEC8|nr:hypothetical protein T552_04206 [Pneumocystis carinii B80]KTW25994.1 hypothetical protein T552_04206 [Pneumocystis carinii B80]
MQNCSTIIIVLSKIIYQIYIYYNLPISISKLHKTIFYKTNMYFESKKLEKKLYNTLYLFYVLQLKVFFCYIHNKYTSFYRSNILFS